MPASRTLVTIVTENRRFDLSVPSALPVREWLPAVVEFRPGSLAPTAPMLAAADAVPLPPDASLDDAGVVDGAVLHLLDGWSRQERA